MLIHVRNAVISVILCATLIRPAACDLPTPATGGPDGNPIAVLVLAQSEDSIDKAYRSELAEAGYAVTSVSFWQKRLTLDYLKHFGVVILTDLPSSFETYTVHAWQLAQNLAPNTEALHAYIEAGGGVVFLPAVTGGGRALTDSYNHFLQRYGIRHLIQLVRPSAEYDGPFAEGEIYPIHAVSEGLEHLLYPTNVLRWDDAYPNTPLIPSADEWQVLAAAKEGHGTYSAINNSQVHPERRTTERRLFALRPVGRGLLAVSGIHRYYLLSHVNSKADHIGENNTGLIDGAVMRGEPEGRPSQMGALLDRTYRFLGANSARSGIGGGTNAEPEEPPSPEFVRKVDWDARELPPSWQHRVAVSREFGIADDFPDPLAEGELTFFRALIGPRTAFSSGSGTVAEYRQAALAAGYHAIVFAERFEDLDEDELAALVQACDANSDGDFVCVPGLDMEDSQGNRYIVAGAQRWPDPLWMEPDGKRIKRTNMFSLGWGTRKLVSVHRPGRTPLHPQMLKHYNGITVATYDSDGKLVDDGMHAYQWSVGSDSNPVPVAVHELTAPGQVAKAAATGFQQIMPGVEIGPTVDYFLHPHAHFFDCPHRYVISEGPVLDVWTIINKDLSRTEDNRDKYRIGIGIRADSPLTEVTLYDRFRVFRRWRPGTTEFRQLVDGHHDAQHMFSLLARDSKGRRVLSPQIRTVVRNYRLRCSDRQNWTGNMPTEYIYTGWRFRFGSFGLPLHNARESVGTHDAVCPIFDHPFFSNHVQIVDTDATTKYIDATGKVYGDAAPSNAVRPTDLHETRVRSAYFHPLKRKDFAVMLVESELRVKRDVEPEIRGPVYPVVWQIPSDRNSVVLPGRGPEPLAEVNIYDPKRKRWTRDKTGGNPGNARIDDLPVGAYVGGMIPLVPGLRLAGREVGFAAPPRDTLTIPKHTTWKAAYLLLFGKQLYWRNRKPEAPVDPVAEQALRQMGFRGETPYRLVLRQGELTDLAYIADIDAADGVVAGRCENAANEELLYYLPLRIQGLNGRAPAALWRSDNDQLEYFGIFHGTGYVFMDADSSVDFFAGNVVQADGALFIEVVEWTADTVSLRLNNPTVRAIETDVRMASIPGRKPLQTHVTVPAGATLEIR